MTLNPRLENYLSALEKALGSIPISDRVDIVTEIKSHVMDAMEKDPENSIENILISLGEPQVVANRYLMEKGLKPVKPSRTGLVVKWLVIGFLGTVAIAVIFVVIMIWKFTPLVKVNENSGKVEILGGMINVQGEAVNGFPMGNMPMAFKKSIDVSGSKYIDKQKIDEIFIKFDSAKIEIRPSEDNRLVWQCYAGKKSDFVEQRGKKIEIDMNNIDNGFCTFNMPEKVKVKIIGKSGLVLAKPKSDIDIKINEGVVSLYPENQEYKFDLNVNSGMINGMENRQSSQKKDANKIKVNVGDGMIQIN